MYEFVTRVLVFAKKSDEVADGRYDGFTLLVSMHFGDLDGIVNEAFEVIDGIAEVDCVVQVSDDWFVSGDDFSETLCEVIWLRATEDLDDLLSVSDG